MNPQLKALVALSGVIVASCSSGSPTTTSESCAAAAFDQATIELELASILEEHSETADATDSDDGEMAAEFHSHPEDLILAARIDLIIAEAATRNRCG